MTSVYPIKAKIISYGSSESMKTLNRRLHWGKRGIVFKHDPRHVDALVKDFGLEHGNSVQTPATHDATEEEQEPLDKNQHSKYRSQVVRCFFLSQDRADITFIVSGLRQRMSKPTQKSLAKLKRLVTYSKSEKQWAIQRWKNGRRSDNVYRFRFGRLQGNSKIIKRRRDTARQSRPEKKHTRASKRSLQEAVRRQS